MSKKAKGKDKESLRQYLAEANGWETDAVARANRASKISLIVGILGIGIGLAGVLAVKGLTPLKQVVPVLIRVDNATGITEVIDQLTDAKTNYQESVNKYFLQKYVRYREGFNRATAERNYEAVGVMSERAEQTKYFEFFSPRNPQSPLNTHPDGYRTEITIRSTSFLSDSTALVRYIKEQHQPGVKPILSYWAATISFTYQNPPTSQKDREVNPLGFLVTGYRVDPESLNAVEAPSVPSVQPQAPQQQAQPAPLPQPTAPMETQPQLAPQPVTAQPGQALPEAPSVQQAQPLPQAPQAPVTAPTPVQPFPQPQAEGAPVQVPAQPAQPAPQPVPPTQQPPQPQG